MKTSAPSLKILDAMAKLMDSQFRIPGTQVRFGLDGIIGLIPVVGDFSTFLVSGVMVMVLARNGASGYVLARMIFNIVLDAVVGSLPIIGDAFDIAFKANNRNMKLMHEHYVHGRHQGGAWKFLLPLFIVLSLLLIGIGWLGYWLFSKLIHWIA